MVFSILHIQPKKFISDGLAALDWIDPFSHFCFVDLPNLFGLITSNLIPDRDLLSLDDLKKRIFKILSPRLDRLFRILKSPLLTRLLHQVNPDLFHTDIHNECALYRFFCKKMIDIAKDRQISAEEIGRQLGIEPYELILEHRVKYHRKTNDVYCDSDFLMIHAAMEALYESYYRSKNLQYIVICSSDKDYDGIIEAAHKMGVITILVSFFGENVSLRLNDLADIIIILYPRVVIRKPFFADRLHQYIDNL